MADAAGSPERQVPKVFKVPPSQVKDWAEFKDALQTIGEKVILLPWPWCGSMDNAQPTGKSNSDIAASEEIEGLRADYDKVQACFTAVSDESGDMSTIPDVDDGTGTASELPAEAGSAPDLSSDSRNVGAAAGIADPSEGDASIVLSLAPDVASEGSESNDGDGMEATGRVLHEALARVCRTRRLNGQTERDCEMLVSTFIEHVVDALNQTAHANSVAMTHDSRLDSDNSNFGRPDLAILKKKGNSDMFVPRIVVEVKPISSTFFTSFTHREIDEEAQSRRKRDIKSSETELKTSLGQLCSYMYRGNVFDGVLTNGASYFLVVRRMVKGGPPAWIILGPRTITELLDVDPSSRCLAVTTTYEAVREDLNGCMLELAAFIHRALEEKVAKTLDVDTK